MSVLWAGGELEDFPVTNGTPSNNTGATTFRSGYGRCSVTCNAVNESAGVTLASSYTTIWMTAHLFGVHNLYNNADGKLIGFTDGGAFRLGLANSDSATATIKLATWDDATLTYLGSDSIAEPSSGIYRIDIGVENYGTNATVQVWFDGVLEIEYTGDVTAGGSTDLDGMMALKDSSIYDPTLSFSEVILAEEDTRELSLVTLAPTSEDTNTFDSGGETSVDEVPADGVFAVSGTADQELIMVATDLPSGTDSVERVIINAWAKDNGSDPDQLLLGVKETGYSANYGSGNALGTSLAKVSETFTTNPRTGSSWSRAEVDDLMLAYKSQT